MSSKVGKGQEPIPYQALLDKNHALQDENRALQDEVQNLKARLAESAELRRAIIEGDLDAQVISGAEEELIFTLDSANRAYRVLELIRKSTVTDCNFYNWRCKTERIIDYDPTATLQ